VATYAKIQLVAFERAALSAGNDCVVCDLNTKAGIVKLGVLICYDRVFLETTRILRLKGAELTVIPLCDGINDQKLAMLQTRTYDNQVGVVMTNYYDPDPREANGSLSHMMESYKMKLEQ